MSIIKTLVLSRRDGIKVITILDHPRYRDQTHRGFSSSLYGNSASDWAESPQSPPLQWSKTIINRFLKNRNKFESWEIERKNDELYKSHQRGQGYDPGRARKADEHDGSIDWTIRKAISKVKYTFAQRNSWNTAVQCFRNYWRRNGSDRLSQDQIL